MTENGKSEVMCACAQSISKQDWQVRETEKQIKYKVTVDRKSTRLNSSHLVISYAVFCLKKKNMSLWKGGSRWLPLPLARSYSRSHPGTGQVVHHLFDAKHSYRSSHVRRRSYVLWYHIVA